jgi:hypothetical protein
LLLGDFNAYSMEEPLGALAGNGFENLRDGSGGYGYVFDGQWGSLDHALGSQSIVAAVTGAAAYHINADEPSVLDYNTDFKSTNHVEILFAPDEYRTSDHDPVVVGLSLDSGFTATVSPGELWAPNHTLRLVEVSGAAADGSPLDVTILQARSSEADSGLNNGDRPNDIQIVSDSEVLLRAERFAREGRSYTLAVRLTDGSQVVFTEIEVHVPHDQGR